MAITATIPNVFVANTVIKSASMNANFSYLVGILNTNILPAVNVANSIVTTDSSGNFQASSYSSVIGNISPLTTKGDLFGFSSSNARIPVGSDGNVLTADSTQTLGVKWAPQGAPKAPTVQTLLSTGTIVGYVFTCSSANATVGATYTNNATTFTVLQSISSGTLLFCSSAGAPTSSGTLTKSSGTGDSTITFSAKQGLATYTTPTSPSPLYIQVEMVGGGGGGGGGGSSAGSSAGSGLDSSFGIVAVAGGGGAGQWNNTSAASNTSSLSAPAIGIALNGAMGTVGANSGTVTIWTNGGDGATSPFGGAGAANQVGNAGLNAQANTGSGGGGGSGPEASGAAGGSGGGSGGYVKAIFTSPSSTYFYSVGTGGSGGGAGGSGFAGGDGAAGLIIVTEYYQ